MNDLQFFLEVAEACARQSTCLRRHYGAVVVNPKYRTIVSSGFNGAPRGKPHCDDTGFCVRVKLGVPMGEQYQWCNSNHAELNAVLQSGQHLDNCVLYLYGWDVELNSEIIPKPCFMCNKMLLNAGIDKVYTRYHIFNMHDLYEAYMAELYQKINPPHFDP